MARHLSNKYRKDLKLKDRLKQMLSAMTTGHVVMIAGKAKYVREQEFNSYCEDGALLLIHKDEEKRLFVARVHPWYAAFIMWESPSTKSVRIKNPYSNRVNPSVAYDLRSRLGSMIRNNAVAA